MTLIARPQVICLIVKDQREMETHNADFGGHAVYGLGLLPLSCWDCKFKSRWGHGCMSVVSVVCCQVEVSAMGRSLVQRSSTECVCVIECDQVVQ